MSGAAPNVIESMSHSFGNRKRSDRFLIYSYLYVYVQYAPSLGCRLFSNADETEFPMNSVDLYARMHGERELVLELKQQDDGPADDHCTTQSRNDGMVQQYCILSVSYKVRIHFTILHKCTISRYTM